MARTKTPEIVKVEEAILALTDDDATTIQEWLDMLLEVRQQEKERREKKAEGPK